MKKEPNSTKKSKGMLRTVCAVLASTLLLGTLAGCSDNAETESDDMSSQIQSGTLTLPESYSFDASYVSCFTGNQVYGYDFENTTLQSLKSDSALKFNSGSYFSQSKSGLSVSSSNYDSVGINKDTSKDEYTYSVKMKHGAISDTDATHAFAVGVRCNSSTALVSSGIWAYCRDSKITFYVNGATLDASVSNLPVSFEDGATLTVEDNGSGTIEYYVSSVSQSKTLAATMTISSRKIRVDNASGTKIKEKNVSSIPTDGYCRSAVYYINGSLENMRLEVGSGSTTFYNDKDVIAFIEGEEYCFAGLVKYDLDKTQKAKCFKYADGYYLPADVLADATGLDYSIESPYIKMTYNDVEIAYLLGENEITVAGATMQGRMPVQYKDEYFICVDEFAQIIGYDITEDPSSDVVIMTPPGTDTATYLSLYRERFALYESVVFNYDDVECDQIGVGVYPKVPEEERLVGVAYTTWRYEQSSWGPGHTWDMPLLGEYLSSDPKIIRQHAIWLADAGVDFIVIDWSNNVGYVPETMEAARPDFAMIENATLAVFDVFATVENAPKICIMTGPGHIGTNTFTNGQMARKNNQIYNTYIADKRRNEMYFYYEDKPLLLCYAATPSFISDGRTAPYVDQRFTERWVTGFVGQQSNLYNKSTYASYMHWSWEERIRQTYCVQNGIPECMTVVASYRQQGEVGGSGYIPAGGRNNGATFRTQWQRANDIGTKFALVVSFNEWTIGEQQSLEVSKDIEPSETLGTMYLDILKEQIKKFKGKVDETTDTSEPWAAGAYVSGYTSHYKTVPQPITEIGATLSGWYAGSDKISSFKYSINGGAFVNAAATTDGDIASDISPFMPGCTEYNTYSFTPDQSQLTEIINTVDVYAVTSSGESILCAQYTVCDASMILITPVEGSSLTVDRGGNFNYIRVDGGTTAEDILSQLVIECDMPETICTGAVMELVFNGEVCDTVYIIVNGDVNADGIVNGVDVLKVQKIIDGREVKPMNFMAADVSCDGSITKKDVALIARSIIAK